LISSQIGEFLARFSGLFGEDEKVGLNDRNSFDSEDDY